MKHFLVKYSYTESGATEECGFFCQAENVRAAAEKFWNQHPGEWFKLISVITVLVDGTSIEAFWSASHARFITIPE